MRYKSKKFNVLSGGQGQAYADDLTKFSTSAGVAIDLASQKIQLCNLLEVNQMTGTDNYDVKGGNNQVLARWNDEVYIPVFDDALWYARLWKFSNAGAPTMIALALPTNPLESYALISFKDKLIYSCDAGLYYSTNPTVAWTNIASPTMTQVNAYASDGQTLYIIANNGTYNGVLFFTTDGITWTELGPVFDNSSSYYYYEILEFFDGFLYALIGDEKDKNKVYLKRLENNVFVTVKSFHVWTFPSMKKFNDKLYIVYEDQAKNLLVRSYDGDEIRTENKIYLGGANKFDISATFASADKLYFHTVEYSNPQRARVYSIDRNEAVFLEFDYNLYWPYQIIENKGVLHLFATKMDAALHNVCIFNNYNQKFQASGTLENSILDDGEIVPKQLILRHKPLAANTSVKVYVKKDHAASWGSAVLTSDTAGAVKKKYTFPTGSVHDFMQFKLELITTDNLATPQDVSLEFLYLPVGLENAK